MLVWITFAWVDSMIHHGEPRPPRHAVHATIGLVVMVMLLWFGGFWK
jgi:hypothetical protein